MSIKALVKRIEAENELFNSMSKAEKRVKIAQDCLERIYLQTFKAVTGALLRYDTQELLQLKPDVKSTVNSNIQCEACAKGGLFLSYVGRVNEFQSCDLDFRNNKIYGNEHRKLLEIFTAKQLALIEYAFEGDQHITSDLKGKEIEFTLREQKAAEEFYWLYDDSTLRMVAICENIIKNKGTFKI